MSIYGPCVEKAAGDLEESQRYTDARVRQLHQYFLPKTGPLRFQTASLDRQGLSIRGGNLSINTLGGGPEVDILQRTSNTESTLPGGLRISNSSNDAAYQLGWSDDGCLAVYYTTRADPQIRVVGKFSPTHLTSLAPPEKPQDVATKEYVDSHKQVVTIWAEEKGPLTSNLSEWSFGSDAEGRPHSKCGYPMSASGRLKSLGLACTSQRGKAIGTVSVSVALDGKITNIGITKSAGKITSHTRVDPPLEIGVGSVVNFVSRTTNVEARSSIISALIELDP